MAQIWIKGRKEPIEVSREIAKQVKHRWCGDPSTGAGKADKTDVFQIDDFAGEYGMIKMIEIDKIKVEFDHEAHRKAQEAEEEKQRQEWLQMPPEKKAKHLGQFKLAWSVRHNFSKEDPPQDVLDQAEKLQLEYYRNNPQAEAIPPRVYESLLPGKPESLVDRMKMK